MGVYGNMLASFPELKRRLKVWTREDKSDLREVVGIYMATAGDRLVRKQYAKTAGYGRSAGSAIDYTCDDELFVSRAYLDKIGVGDYIEDPDDHAISKIVGKEQWVFQGSFVMFTTQRVSGAIDGEHTEKLQIKEAQFA